jgi:hypothetical protein
VLADDERGRRRGFYPGGNATALSLITEPLRKYARPGDLHQGRQHRRVDQPLRGPQHVHRVPDRRLQLARPTVKSVDQLIADSIEASPTPTTLKSLHLGVIPADTINYYQRVGRNTFFFAPRPVDYEANPVTAFDRVFLGAPPSNGPTPASPDYSKDVMDLVGAEMKELNAELGAGATSELAKLKQHQDAWSVFAPKPAPMSMMSAAALATPMPTVEKLRPMLEGNPRDAYKHQYFSDMFDAQVDNMARALVSGLTRVATMQAGSADNNVTVPVGPGYPHHLTSHGDQNIYNQLQKWYFGKLARFAGLLDVPDPLESRGQDRPGKHGDRGAGRVPAARPRQHRRASAAAGHGGRQDQAGPGQRQRHHQQGADGHHPQRLRGGAGALRVHHHLGDPVVKALSFALAVGVLASAGCTGEAVDSGNRGGGGPGAGRAAADGNGLAGRGGPGQRIAGRRQQHRQRKRRPRAPAMALAAATVPPDPVPAAATPWSHLHPRPRRLARPVARRPRQALASPADRPGAGGHHPCGLQPGQDAVPGGDDAARRLFGRRVHQQRRPPDGGARLRARRARLRARGGPAGVQPGRAGASCSPAGWGPAPAPRWSLRAAVRDHLRAPGCTGARSPRPSRRATPI